ncbi:MAG: HNH endonuclease [Defluviitaleaceae bacterium]|nr:HNH endonuclease [Defluviitaleaceae bacterium]
MEYKIEKYVRSRTDEELLNDLKRVADANSGKVTQKLYREYRKTVDSSLADGTTICKQIGWSTAVALIGVETSKYQNNKKITEEELLNEILRLWTELGRQPTTTDIKNGLCKYSRNRFSIFGGWGGALTKFIEWVNNEGLVSSPDVKFESKNKGRLTSRDINLRLRFKVMQRDNFKCQMCGVAPSNDPTIKLHVDHCTPWAKGGETEIDNLQTLCQNCNLGKSDLT